MLPKYHCEFNPIKRVWAQAKQYTKAHCKYSIVSLQKTITPALESAHIILIGVSELLTEKIIYTHACKNYYYISEISQ